MSNYTFVQKYTCTKIHLYKNIFIQNNTCTKVHLYKGVFISIEKRR